MQWLSPQDKWVDVHVGGLWHVCELAACYNVFGDDDHLWGLPFSCGVEWFSSSIVITINIMLMMNQMVCLIYLSINYNKLFLQLHSHYHLHTCHHLHISHHIHTGTYIFHCLHSHHIYIHATVNTRTAV